MRETKKMLTYLERNFVKRIPHSIPIVLIIQLHSIELSIRIENMHLQKQLRLNIKREHNQPHLPRALHSDTRLLRDLPHVRLLDRLVSLHLPAKPDPLPLPEPARLPREKDGPILPRNH